jgi:hypothetical protein
MPRQRALDSTKRREICALVSAGYGIRQAARYVRCAASTIRREAQRDPEFHDALCRAELAAQLSPLRAMQQAASTHWRAAAWMLERSDPERFARHDPKSFGPKEARALGKDLLDIFNDANIDPLLRMKIEKRVKATIEYAIRHACDTRRTNRNLRRAMEFFAEKERGSDPVDQFGFAMPDFDALLRPEGQKPAEHWQDASATPQDASTTSEGPPPAVEKTSPGAIEQVNCTTQIPQATDTQGVA